ncbi:MAG: WG repeat-containing protein, partial [Cohnella sp.]|nr:WG repeat-containing protein [Cohnella sp.]
QLDVADATLDLLDVGGKWGYADKKGKMVIKPQYESANNFSEGLAAVSVKGKFGFIDKKGKLVVPAKYDEVYSFSEGMAVVAVDWIYGYIVNPLKK